MFCTMNHLHIKVGVAHSFTSVSQSKARRTLEILLEKLSRKSFDKNQRNVTNSFNSCEKSSEKEQKSQTDKERNKCIVINIGDAKKNLSIVLAVWLWIKWMVTFKSPCVDSLGATSSNAILMSNGSMLSLFVCVRVEWWLSVK